MNKKSTLLILVATNLFFACTPRQTAQPSEEQQKESCFYHTVKYSGETLAAISGWYTGSVSNWPKILAANKGMNERRITLGTDICIPRSLVKKDTPFPKPSFKAPQTISSDTTPVQEPTPEPTVITGSETTTSIEDEVRNSLMQGSDMPKETPMPTVARPPKKPVNQDEDELRKTRERLLREMLLDE